MSADSNQLSEGPSEGSRRRIVIPLNQEQKGSSASRVASPQRGPLNRGPSSPRKSRVGKVLAVFGIIIVALALFVAGGIFLWWQHYKTTPAYSLALLVDAAQRNDMATVESLIDTDQIADNFAGQVKDRAADRYGLALGGLARKQIESAAPKLLPTIRQSVRDALAARVKEISENWGHKPFIVLAVGLPYVANVAVSGDTAKATASVHDQQVELEMRRAENGWKVSAFKDDVLVQRIIDQLIRDLPVIGEGDKLVIRKQNKKLPLSQQRVRLP